jgi:hypothetical protein
MGRLRSALGVVVLMIGLFVGQGGVLPVLAANNCLSNPYCYSAARSTETENVKRVRLTEVLPVIAYDSPAPSHANTALWLTFGAHYIEIGHCVSYQTSPAWCNVGSDNYPCFYGALYCGNIYAALDGTTLLGIVKNNYTYPGLIHTFLIEANGTTWSLYDCPSGAACTALGSYNAGVSYVHGGAAKFGGEILAPGGLTYTSQISQDDAGRYSVVQHPQVMWTTDSAWHDLKGGSYMVKIEVDPCFIGSWEQPDWLVLKAPQPC